MDASEDTVLLFEPVDDFNTPRFRESGDKEVAEVYLKTLPDGSEIIFEGGGHSHSIYRARINGSRIRMWNTPGYGCLEAPIDAVVSIRVTKHEGGVHLDPERGVMKIGRTYLMPYFIYDGRSARADQSRPRMEPYVSIRIRAPSRVPVSP